MIKKVPKKSWNEVIQQMIEEKPAMVTKFTTVERLKNALRTYESDEIEHGEEMSRAGMKVKFLPNPDDVRKVIEEHQKLQELLGKFLAHHTEPVKGSIACYRDQKDGLIKAAQKLLDQLGTEGVRKFPN